MCLLYEQSMVLFRGKGVRKFRLCTHAREHACMSAGLCARVFICAWVRLRVHVDARVNACREKNENDVVVWKHWNANGRYSLILRAGRQYTCFVLVRRRSETLQYLQIRQASQNQQHNKRNTQYCHETSAYGHTRDTIQVLWRYEYEREIEGAELARWSRGTSLTVSLRRLEAVARFPHWTRKKPNFCT